MVKRYAELVWIDRRIGKPYERNLQKSKIKSFDDNKLKTSFAALYDNCVIAASEKGYKAKRLNVKDIKRWEDFCKFATSLEENREAIGDDIKTIVVDTVDKLYPFAQKYVVREYNKNKSSDLPRAKKLKDIPHGQGWVDADDEFMSQITKIIDLGFTFLFVTHNKMKTVSPKNGMPYDTYIPTMPDRCAALIYPLVDFIINGKRTSVVENGITVKKREISFRENEMSSGGSRVAGISDSIVFDTEQEAHQAYLNAKKIYHII